MNIDQIKEEYFDWLNAHNLSEPVSCLTAWVEAYRRGIKNSECAADRAGDSERSEQT